MNETDVREIIIRPFLHRLGYAHGTDANIRSEVPLTYARSYLGRKKPQKDPPLRGRADYICDATSYGRWVVEVKSPNAALSDEDAQQAHTYSAHPEIAASYFLLSNGRQFRLYLTSQLKRPLFEWKFNETDYVFMNIVNILSYDAFKRRARLFAFDPNKPLAIGYPSQVEIITGEITYGCHASDHPLFANLSALVGSIGQVTGGQLQRAADGRLHGVLLYRSPMQHLQPIIAAMGHDRFEFFSADEFISTDPTKPTIFQNATQGHLEPGTLIPLGPGQPEIPFPMGFDARVWTEATGFVEGDRFKGIARFSYDYDLIPGFAVHPALEQIVEAAHRQPQAQMSGEAVFDIRMARL